MGTDRNSIMRRLSFSRKKRYAAVWEKECPKAAEKTRNKSSSTMAARI